MKRRVNGCLCSTCCSSPSSLFILPLLLLLPAVMMTSPSWADTKQQLLLPGGDEASVSAAAAAVLVVCGRPLRPLRLGRARLRRLQQPLHAHRRGQPQQRRGATCQRAVLRLRAEGDGAAVELAGLLRLLRAAADGGRLFRQRLPSAAVLSAADVQETQRRGAAQETQAGAPQSGQ